MQGTTQRYLDTKGHEFTPKGAATINRNADNTINYIQIVADDGESYRQTLTYTTGYVTSVTGWTKQ